LLAVATRVQPTATAKTVYRANVHGFSSSADFATFIGSLICSAQTDQDRKHSRDGLVAVRPSRAGEMPIFPSSLAEL